MNPSTWLLTHIERIKNQRVLDIACGTGRHIQPLLDAGCEVFAVDRNIQTLSTLKKHPRLHLWAQDVEHRALPAMQVDVLVVFMFLHRALFADMARLLRPGGILLHETFHIAHREKFGRPRHEAFCWQVGEAEDLLCHAGFDIEKLEEAVATPSGMMTRLVAKKREEG